MTIPDPSVRFLLFRAIQYDVLGGMDDCIGKYATVEEARANSLVRETSLSSSGKWTEDMIYDAWTGEPVAVIPK